MGFLDLFPSKPEKLLGKGFVVEGALEGVSYLQTPSGTVAMIHFRSRENKPYALEVHQQSDLSLTVGVIESEPET